MRRTLASLITVLFLFSELAAGGEPQRGNPEPKPLKMGRADANTFVGIISDSFCGARHKFPDKSAEECTRYCQRNGAHYVLVAGEKVYQLNGRPNELGYLAGQKVKINGSLKGDTIAVTSAAPTQ